MIDGQHRLYAFTNSNERIDKKNKILCTILDTEFLGEDYEVKQAKIFMDLNMHAKKVEPALLLELKTVLGIEDTPLKIVLRLGEKAILKGAIRSYSSNKHGSINLTTFATNQAIKRLTSKKGPLLINKDIDELKITDYCFKKIFNYLTKVSTIFKEEWNKSAKYILKTDRGIRALLKLYIKIIGKYEEKNIEGKIEEVLMALKKSDFRFDLDRLKGKYSGEAGAKDLVKDWSIYITKEMPDFEPTTFKKIRESFEAEFGKLDAKIEKIKTWFPRLEGDIRGQLMHIDETTFEFLRYLNKDNVESIMIFFGDVANENKVKQELQKFKKEGYDIVLTKAKKPEPCEGALYHTRWIGSSKHQIFLDCDLKKKMMKNAKYVMEFIDWKKKTIKKITQQN